jgi:3-hydroxyacyl-[acyl-carrier-protein] dehydratase
MRFTLIDRIIDLKPGVSITAVKTLSLAEEYLRDHFPLFPVMPGVLMLESMYQTGAWLVRKTDEFAHSMVMLKEARNVKYADFVQPGQVLRVTAQIEKQEGRFTRLKASGSVEGTVTVSARLVLDQYNLADEDPGQAAVDLYTRSLFKEQFALLYPPNGSPDNNPLVTL